MSAAIAAISYAATGTAMALTEQLSRLRGGFNAGCRVCRQAEQFIVARRELLETVGLLILLALVLIGEIPVYDVLVEFALR